MRKQIFIMLLAICLVLTACHWEDTPQQTTQPAYSPYTGSLTHYSYFHADGRDRQWEEDVLYVAEVFLGEVFANGHPYLTDMEFQTFYSMDGKPVEYLNYYKDAMREEFIQDINDLIPRIGEMQDYQILFSLQKAVAKLGDLHSSVNFWGKYEYPVFFKPFYEDDGVYFRAIALPQTHADALMGKLTHINGIPVQEISGKLLEYISYENEHAASSYLPLLLRSAEAMEVIGVTRGITDAVFAFQTLEGEAYSVTLSARDYSAVGYPALYSYALDGSVTPLYRDTDSYYWWEYLPEDRLLYVRFNQIQEDRSLSCSSCVNQLREHIEAMPETKKVVIDLRQNPGGYFHASLSHYLSSFLNQLPGQQSYVLFDGGSYSGAIMLPSNLRQMTENTLFVGAPGGQPANFFASNHHYTSPNGKISFSMSDTMWVTAEDDTGDSLMPDVVIYQTVEDQIQGVDAVLAWVLMDTPKE